MKRSDKKNLNRKPVETPEQFAEKVQAIKEQLERGTRALEFLHLTRHDGKLEGLESLGSVSFVNPYCISRMKNENSVCHHCYVSNYKFRKSLMAHLVLNFERLTAELIPEELLPVFSTVYGRIESFGDVFNVTQARNYIRTIRKNPHVRFAVWSKNIAIWGQAFAIEGKPENCSFVLSSFGVNSPAKVPEKYAWFVNAVFTVYTLDFVKANNTPIHCGFSRCLVCGKCYNSNKSESVVYVNEILKEQAAEYKAWNEAGRPAA